jgi:hypothetical protein
MPRKPPKLREDVAERAYRTLQEALGERPKTVPPSERTEDQRNPEAVKRGTKGGKRGGKARTDALTPKERSEAARLAASARWKKAT